MRTLPSSTHFALLTYRFSEGNRSSEESSKRSSEGKTDLSEEASQRLISKC